MNTTNKIFTVPNLLTVIRLILVPIFIVSFLYVDQMLALGIFVLAALTDVLDGYIARNFNLITKLGKVLDPLADKSLRLSAIIMFVITGVLPVWVLIAIFSFDAFLIITSIILYKRNYVVSSNMVGKLAGFVSILGLTLCFFHDFVAPFHLIFLYFSIALVFASIITYIVKVKKNINFKN
jgi:cardiolipin synthase (CMP-forming)